MALEEGLSVVFTGDTSGLESATKTAANSLSDLGRKSKESGASVYFARDAVMDFGHVARDLPYAANNFSVLAGPIGRISTLMSALKDQTGSLKGAFGALGGALSGGGGVVIGLELAVSAIALLSQSFGDTEEKSQAAGLGVKFFNDQVATSAAETASKTVANITKLSAALSDLDIPLRERTKALDEYNKVADKQNQLSKDDLSNIGKINEAIGRQIELYKERALVKGAEDAIAGLYKTVYENEFKISNAADKVKKSFDLSQLAGQGAGNVKQFTTEIGKLQDATKVLGTNKTFFYDAQISDTQKKIGDLFGFIQRTVKEGDIFGTVLDDSKGGGKEKGAFNFFDKMFTFDPAVVQQGSKQFFEAFNTASEFALKNFHLFQGLDKIIEAPNKEASYKAALDWWKGYQEGIILLKPPRIDIRPEDFPKIISPEDITKTYTDAMSNPFRTPENLGIIDPDSIKRSDIIFKYQNLFKQIGKQMPSIFDYTDDQGRKMKTAINKIPTNDLPKVLGSNIEEQKNSLEGLAKTVSGVVTPAFQDMFKAIEAGKPPLQAFFQGIEQSIEQLIEKLIAAAIEAAVLSALSGGGTSFIAAFGNISGLSISKHAAGGLAYGPSLGMIGEYANAGSNPEVIAPLSKLKGMLGGGIGGGGNIVGVLRGTDIVLLNSRVAKKQSRTS